MKLNLSTAKLVGTAIAMPVYTQPLSERTWEVEQQTTTTIQISLPMLQAQLRGASDMIKSLQDQIALVQAQKKSIQGQIYDLTAHIAEVQQVQDAQAIEAEAALLGAAGRVAADADPGGVEVTADSGAASVSVEGTPEATVDAGASEVPADLA